MKNLLLTIPATALALALLTTSTTPCAAGDCGYKPFKPYVPYGCSDLIAQCQCDARGGNCKWVWVCVPRK